MNIESHDIVQIKKAWSKIGHSLESQCAPDLDPESYKRKKTALDRLRDKYRTFCVISLLMVFNSFLTFSRVPLADSKPNFWLGVVYALYFLIAFCMDYWLWKGIGTIDPLRMSVVEVSGKALFYRKKHLQFVVAIIPIAIVVLGFTVYQFSANIYFLAGMVAGAVCGLVIGTAQLRRFMAEYRNLSE